MHRSILLLLIAIPGIAVLFGLAAVITWMHDHPNRWPFTVAAGIFLLLTGHLAIQWRASPGRALLVG